MELYDISFRCYYADGTFTKHFQKLSMWQISKWIDCYRFTHPEVKAISVKVWFTDKKEEGA